MQQENGSVQLTDRVASVCRPVSRCGGRNGIVRVYRLRTTTWNWLPTTQEQMTYRHRLPPWKMVSWGHLDLADYYPEFWHLKLIKNCGTVTCSNVMPLWLAHYQSLVAWQRNGRKQSRWRRFPPLPWHSNTDQRHRTGVSKRRENLHYSVSS